MTSAQLNSLETMITTDFTVVLVAMAFLHIVLLFFIAIRTGTRQETKPQLNQVPVEKVGGRPSRYH